MIVCYQDSMEPDNTTPATTPAASAASSALPDPAIRYVIMPAQTRVEEDTEAIAEITDLIAREGYISLRVEFRYWDPRSSNNYTWRGKTVNVRLFDVGMAEAVVDGVREHLVRGSQAQGQGQKITP